MKYSKNIIVEIFMTYSLFLVLVGSLAILANILNGEWAGFSKIVLIIRCFDLVEMVIPTSSIHELSSDSFDLLAAHLLIFHFYISYMLYVYLKIKYNNNNKLLRKNLSPFLLSFGIILSLCGALSILAFPIIWPYTIYIVIRFGAYNIIGLILQYLAYKNKNPTFLKKSVAVMVMLNVAGLIINLYPTINEMLWRFNIMHS